MQILYAHVVHILLHIMLSFQLTYFSLVRKVTVCIDDAILEVFIHPILFPCSHNVTIKIFIVIISETCL